MDFQISIIIYQEKTFLSAFLPLAGERVVSMLYGAFKIAAFKLLLLSWAANHFSFCPFSGCPWGVAKVESSARVPCLLEFILLVSFSDTLLVGSMLDYDCHLRPFLQS